MGLERSNLEMIAFVVFIVVTIVATVLSKRMIVRRIYVVGLVAIILYCGLSGANHYPFISWHLFGYRAEPLIDFFELRVADEQGKELKYDARAVRPSLASPIRRLALKMAEMRSDQFVELSIFLTNEARLYYIQPPILDELKFPPHQIGYKWKDTDIGIPVGLRIYRVEVQFSEDGREVIATTETLARSIDVY